MTPDPIPTILPPEQARDLLRQAITEHLGDDWDAPNSRWVVVTNHDYMARLNKGRVNVDFYVDYFSGKVTVERSEVNSGQEVGRGIAWTLAILFTVMVFLTARGLGWL